MAHQEQIDFCLKIKQLHPSFFENKNVLDAGSLDINGNNRYLFDNSTYCGLDIGEGNNVDIVSKIHEYNGLDGQYNFIISTECFEHDMYYSESITNIIRLLDGNGFFLFTCATTDRPEHGTNRSNPVDAPFLANYESWSDYYKNLTEQDIRNVIDIDLIFKEYAFEINEISHDLYFWGIKK